MRVFASVLGAVALVCCVSIGLECRGAGPDRPEPVALCSGENFLSAARPFQSVKLPENASPSMISSDDDCLRAGPDACKQRIPLDRSSTWIAGARVGRWICVSDGRASGWAEVGSVQFAPLPKTAFSAWTGTWKSTLGGGRLRITFMKDRGVLHVKGNAEWQGGPDTDPNIGEVDDDGVLQANLLHLGDPACLDNVSSSSHAECSDCAVRLMLIGPRLMVLDNHKCGGMNVNFDGLYARVAARKAQKKR